MTAKTLDVFEDLDLNSNAAIEASAGTGKTYTIGSLVIRYILGDISDSVKFPKKYRQNKFLDIKNLLIVTFTKAAAADLKRKILERIIQTRELFELFLLSENYESLEKSAEPFVKQLAKRYKNDDGKPKNNLLREAIKLLKNAERDIDLAAISTIHSFCQKILKISAFESKLMFRFDFLDSSSQISKTKLCDALRKMFYESGDSLSEENKLLNAKIFNDLFGRDRNQVKNFLKLVNDLYTEQSGTVSALSNGTTANHSEYLLNYYNYQKLVEDTFEVLNSKALLGNEIAPDDISKFDDKLNYLLQLVKPKNLKGTKNDWHEYSDKFNDKTYPDDNFTNQFGNTKKGFKCYYNVNNRSKKENFFAFTNRAVRDIETTNGMDKSFIEFFDFRAILAKIVELISLGSHSASYWILNLAKDVVDSLKEWKSQNNLLSFDDLIIKLKEALDEDKPNNKVSATLLKNRIRELYPVAFIDEFQDTDENQWKLFSSIYDEQSKVDGCNIYIIGDPKQAIYRFRNADIYTYFNAKKSVSNVQNLAINFRSTPQVVDSVNKLFMANLDDPGKSFGAEREITFSKVDSKDKDKQICRNVDNKVLPPVSFTAVLNGSKKNLISKALAKACSEQIKRFTSEYSFCTKKSIDSNIDSSQDHKRIRYGDCAVLVQDRNESNLVRKALQRLNIKSIYLSDDSKVYSSRKVTSFMKKFMAAVINNSDYGAIKRLLLDPLNCLPLQYIDKVFSNAKLFSELSSVLSECLIYWKKNNFVRALYTYAFSKKIWEGADLFLRLSLTDKGERDVTDLCHMAECLQCEMRSSSSVFDLYQKFDDLIESASQNKIDDESIKARLSASGEYVRIVTMHKSKGLEYPVVLMPFVLLWGAKASAKGKDKDKYKVRSVVVHEDSDAESGVKKRKRYVMGIEKTKQEQKILEQADSEDQKELSRLLYVAVTRATHHNWYGICSVDAKESQDKSVLGSVFCHQYDCSMKDQIDEKCSTLAQELLTIDTNTVDTKGKTDTVLLAWNAYLDRLGKDNFCEFELKDAEDMLSNSNDLYDSENQNDSLFDVSTFNGKIDRDWGITSFSKLNKLSSDVASKRSMESEQNNLENNEDHADDYEGAPAEDEPNDPDEFSRFSFPRGPKPGDFLHNLMEQLKFSAEDENFKEKGFSAAANRSERISWYKNESSCNGNSLQDAVEEVAQKSFFAGSKTLKKWIEHDKGLPKLAEWFSDIVNTPIPIGKESDGKCVRLSDINDKERLSEVNFSFSIGPIQAEQINILLNNVSEKKQWVNLNGKALDFPKIQGYLTGFIDLLFRHNGKFYLVDYKSNILHKEFKDFNAANSFCRENMEKEIVEHRYDFQYAVYCVAIYRYLKSRHRGPDEFSFSKVFGGIAYLFLRGMRDVDENALPKSSHEIGLSDIDVPGVFDVRLPSGWGGDDDAFIKSLNAIFEKSSALGEE